MSKRYHFNVIGDGNMFRDDDGLVLPGPGSAKRVAATLAAELAQDGTHYNGFVVCAVDDEGNEVARVPVVSGNVIP